MLWRAPALQRGLMNTLTVTSKDQFLEQLDEELFRKLSKKEAERISRFSRHYLMHLPLEELLERQFHDTYGAVMAAWQFMQKRPAEKTPVSVFNPDLESDGWQSTHTVIFILHPDIPFLIDSVRMAINHRDIGTHTIHHSIMTVERDSQGNLKSLDGPEASPDGSNIEAFIVLEIDRHSDQQDLASLEVVLEILAQADAQYKIQWFL